MIIETARSVYGQCKVFREDYPENDDKDVDFTNMVGPSFSFLMRFCFLLFPCPFFFLYSSYQAFFLAFCWGRVMLRYV